MEKNVYILASASPRRRQLLHQIGLPFKVMSAQIDETQKVHESPAMYVLRLAIQKARVAAQMTYRNWSKSQVDSEGVVFILAADTAVVDGYKILTKPVDEADALCTLSRLRQRMHQVYTGLALLCLKPDNDFFEMPDVLDDHFFQSASDLNLLTDLCISDVFMRNYSDEEILEYVSSGDPFDKAGSYAIQDTTFKPVVSLRGCYANVMGLPLCHLKNLLYNFRSQIGPLDSDWPLAFCKNLAGDHILSLDYCQQFQ